MGLRSGGSNERFPVLRGKRPSARPPGRLGRSERSTRDRANGLHGRQLFRWPGRVGPLERSTGGAGALPRKRPSLAKAGLAGRSLQRTFLAGRRGCPEGPRRRPPQAFRLSCTAALGARGPSRSPVLSRQRFRLQRFPRTRLAEYTLGPDPSHVCSMQPDIS